MSDLGILLAYLTVGILVAGISHGISDRLAQLLAITFLLNIALIGWLCL